MSRSILVYILWVTAAAIWLGTELAYTAGWRINHTASLPMGLWRVSALDRPVARGDVVSLCPPDTAVFQEARQRGYIGNGRCPGGFEPLLKPVAAIGGDRVEVSAAGIAINGHLLRNSAAVQHDREGQPLMAMPAGAFIAAIGELWLVSDYSPASFDSRYFGPLNIKQVLGIAHR